MTASALSDPSRSLLLVDDEEYVLSALKRALRRDGYRIATAPSGVAALDFLANTKVAVIVSDQRMPGMSGIEFLRRVAAACPDTIRIILSGDRDLAVFANAVDDGTILKFLTKPWEVESLRDEIRDAFRRHAQFQAPS